jgi:hypothetical protein
MNSLFETSAPKYDWMNHIIAAATGQRPADGPLYSSFEVHFSARPCVFRRNAMHRDKDESRRRCLEPALLILKAIQL